MNDSQTQVLQNVADMLKVARNGLTKADFLASFQNVVALVTKINKEMIKRQDDSFVQITAQFKALEKEVKTASKDAFGTLKTDLVSKVNTALKEQANGMKFLYDKINALEDGEDGEDGKTPTKEELIALITPLIPKLVAPQEVDIDSVVKQVLEKVQEQIPKVSLGSRIGWGAHPLVIAKSGTIKEKVARHLNFKGTGVTSVVRNPDGTVDVTITAGGAGGATKVRDEDASGLTLAHTPDANTLQLFRGGTRQSIVNGDYTIVGAVITLTNALATGEKLTADYEYT